MPTFLEKNTDAVLTKFRSAAHTLSQELPSKLTLPSASELFEQLEKGHTEPSILSSLTLARDWLRHGTVPPNESMKIPANQCAMGLALFINKALMPPEKRDIQPIHSLPRLQEEQMHAAVLCGSFIGNHSTKITFGEPGSWFYYAPQLNTINIEIAQALILGLENSRGILLHEIGHSLITLGRTPKMDILQQKMEVIRNNAKKSKSLNTNEAKLYQKHALELDFRENAFQYMEDSAVNTFAEVIGTNLNTNITTALLRNYSLISSARHPEKSDELSKQIQTGLKSSPKRKAPDELQNILTHLQNAYPLSKGFAGDNLESANLIGLTPTPEGLLLQNAIVGKPNSASTLQPLLQTTRVDRLIPNKLKEANALLFAQRTAAFDTAFDAYILPLLAPLLEDIENQTTNITTLTIDSDLLEQEEEKQKKEEKKEKQEKEETSQKKEGGNEKTIGELLQNLKDKAEQEHQSQKKANRQWENLQKNWEEALKSSTSAKDIFDEIPELADGEKNYEGVKTAFALHIQKMARLLDSVFVQQKLSRKKQSVLVPDPILGSTGLNVHKLLKKTSKESTSEKMEIHDLHYWDKKTEINQPAITNFILHMDLTGSMYGEPAKMTAAIAIALKESLKKHPAARVFATASCGGVPQLIMGPQLTPLQEQKILGGLLQTGEGNGSNEIDAAGIQFSIEKTLEIPLGPKDKMGKTHFIMITDGGISPLVSNKIVETLSYILKNPLLEFDILIVDEFNRNALSKSLETAAAKQTFGKRPPTIIAAQSPQEMLKKIFIHFKTQITKHPIYENPQTQLTHKLTMKKLHKKVGDIALGMY